jgi:hypothetical protein
MNLYSFTTALVILYTDHMSRWKLDQQNQICGLLTASLLEDHEAVQEEQSVHCSDNNDIICISDTAPKMIMVKDLVSYFGILLERNYVAWCNLYVVPLKLVFIWYTLTERQYHELTNLNVCPLSTR